MGEEVVKAGVEKVRRSKGGRPRKPDGEKLRQVSVLLKPGLIEEVSEAASAQGVSRSEYIREAVAARVGRPVRGRRARKGASGRAPAFELHTTQYMEALKVLSALLSEVRRLDERGVDLAELGAVVEEHLLMLDEVRVVESLTLGG